MFPPGTKVKKISGKPFKSRFQINTVKEIVISPFTGKESVSFLEDESIVECFRLEKV